LKILHKNDIMQHDDTNAKIYSFLWPLRGSIFTNPCWEIMERIKSFLTVQA
jgi:hypothetical protein